MTTVARCSNVTEATQLKMLLEAAGISVFIPDETAASIAPHLFLNQSGVRVQVADEQAEEARELIRAGGAAPAGEA